MTDKVTDINDKLERKLFDVHMQTMFDLTDELLERYNDGDDLTEKEDAFLDAFMEWNNFLVEKEE